MNTRHGGQVHRYAFSCLAQPTRYQADLLQTVADRFSVVIEPFSANQRDPIDLVRNFGDEDSHLVCVRQVESCLQCHGF